MRPSIQNMKKLLNRRTMTLFAVCLLLLAAVAANVIMNRNDAKTAGKDTTRKKKTPSLFIIVYLLSLEKAMASHSSTLAWKIPWTEEPGKLQSMGSLRVGHD